MKRILPFVFFFLTTLFASSLQSFAQCTGANMGNPIVVGTIGAGSAYSNTQYNGNSCFGNDYGQPSYDIYYRFTITSSLQVDISHCGSGFDTYMWLLDVNGNLVYSDDDGGPLCSSNEASISQTLSAGTYYVVSEGFSSNSGNIVTQISIPGSSGGSTSWALNGLNIYNTNAGNVGIGQSTPAGKLSFEDVSSTSSPVGITWNSSNGTADPTQYGIHKTAGPWSAPDYQQLRLGWQTGIVLNPGTAYGKSYVDIQGNGLRVSSGNVGIGTTDTKGYKLAVNGDAIFTKVKVKSYSTWPDYVFAPAYALPSLAQVEAFIRQYKHLPEVPSANDVAEKGLDVGDNQAVLLKKIEELTLYIIEQNKKIEQLEKEVQAINATHTH